MKKRGIKAYLNPNPVLQGETLVDPHGRQFEMNNSPFICLEMYNYPKGEYTISLINPIKKTLKVKITSRFQEIYFIDDKLMDTSIKKAEITIIGGKNTDNYSEDIGCVCLHGRIKDFYDKPRQAYAWFGIDRVTRHKAVIQSDKNGDYKLYLPKNKRIRVFINDKSYGTSTLECWIMAKRINQDVLINPHIGGVFEFYELNVWMFDNIWNIFFLPAIVDRDIPLKLSAEDINVNIDGQKADIEKFTQHQVYFKGKSKGLFYPAYIISASPKKRVLPKHEPVPICVWVDSKKVGKGEAWYIYDRTED